jgi:hypothetical protein
MTEKFRMLHAASLPLQKWGIVEIVEPEPKTITPTITPKIIALTIEEDGDLTFLNTESSKAFLEVGTAKTRRASHVEPVNVVYRVLFHALRFFGDKNKMAEWTRHWPVLWRVNTKPVGGPILTWAHVYPKWPEYKAVATWRNRQEAIEAEIKFLNNWFVSR